MVFHGIRAKLVSNWNKACYVPKGKQILRGKRISMLTGLKLSSVSVYFTDQNMQRGDPMELNCEVFEMQK